MNTRMAIVKEHSSRRKLKSVPIENVTNKAGRWSCHHHHEGSDIEAYVMATDGLEVIAQTRAVEGLDAHANAELIIRAVNAYERTQPIIAELVLALEMCLMSETLSPEAAHEAELALGRARKLL